MLINTENKKIILKKTFFCIFAILYSKYIEIYPKKPKKSLFLMNYCAFFREFSVLLLPNIFIWYNMSIVCEALMLF